MYIYNNIYIYFIFAHHSSMVQLVSSNSAMTPKHCRHDGKHRDLWHLCLAVLEHMACQRWVPDEVSGGEPPDGMVQLGVALGVVYVDYILWFTVIVSLNVYIYIVMAGAVNLGDFLLAGLVPLATTSDWSRDPRLPQCHIYPKK